MIPSTEGFHPIPHEFIDRGDSSFWEKNWHFSHSSDFPLIGFNLSDDLLEVAHLLSCDHVVKIWWQFVLIWPQIERILIGSDFWAFCFYADSRFPHSSGFTHGQSTTSMLATSKTYFSTSSLADLNCGQSTPWSRTVRSSFF